MSNNFFQNIKSAINITVVVASLGYFVDMYDLLLYGIIRVPSLKALGITGDNLINTGVFLLNMQMVGMLIGGIIWGILGDKKGRVSVLFGSIILYSLANIANAFVNDIGSYAVARFLAGVGLAGELGAAVTLVSEVLPKEIRGYGTTIVASVGIMGSVTAAIVGDFLSWRVAYLVGGGLGLILLLMRAKMFESGMFKGIAKESVRKGDFLSLFTSRERFFKYLRCIIIGLPTWFVVGILIMLSPEFAKVLGIKDPIIAGRSIMFTYLGLVLGDIVSGFTSQLIKSRKRVVSVSIYFTFILSIVYLSLGDVPVFVFYALTFCLGVSIGYWAVFVTIAAEQFGTNLRATVTTTVPNFVRGAVVLITSSFQLLRTEFGMIGAAYIVGFTIIFLALVSLYYMEETYHKDLNYLEK